MQKRCRACVYSRMRCDELRLTGSGGANRVMEAELKRLVMRSPFDVRVPKPKREGEATLLYPFDARIAWVAACHHRTSSRISWDLFSSTAVRLEPLFEELLPALTADDRLPAAARLRFSVDLGSAQDFEASPLQLRGVVKNAIVEALASRGVTAEVDADAPDVVFVVRRAGTPERRRTVVGIDIGLRRAASTRRAGCRAARAAARDDGGAARSCCRGGTRDRSCSWIRWPAAARSRSKPRAWRSAPPSGGRPTAVPSPGGIRRVAERGARISFPGPFRASLRSTSTRSDPRDGRQPARRRPDRRGLRELDRHRADGCARADARTTWPACCPAGKDMKPACSASTRRTACASAARLVKRSCSICTPTWAGAGAIHGLARRMFRRERAFRVCLRPFPDDDQAGDQRGAARRVSPLQPLKGGLTACGTLPAHVPN